MRKRIAVTWGLVFAVVAVVMVVPAQAATKTVVCSPTAADPLEDAIRQAQDGDQIDFAGPCRVGVLTIDRHLTLFALSDDASITVDTGSGSYRYAINVRYGGDLTIRGARLQVAKGRYGGILWVDSASSLHLRDATVTGATLGGGVTVDGKATIEKTIITHNSAFSSEMVGGNHGGGVTVRGNVTIEDSTIEGNASAGDGGGILVASGGVLTLEMSTLDMNSASSPTDHAGGSGGGIAAEANSSVHVLNSTIGSNFAVANNSQDGGGTGGGILSRTDDFTLVESTVSQNRAYNSRTGGLSQGGGIMADDGKVTTTASVIAGNIRSWTRESDCSGNVVSTGDTFLGTTYECKGYVAGPRDKTGNPMLGDLKHNKGPTQTMAPLPGSPLIDSVPSDTCVTDTDQRHIGRPIGKGCDIGAVEYDPSPGTDGVRCTIVGTDGDDVLHGRRADDVICGNGGDDQLFGGGGDDVIRGWDGADIIAGGRGDDQLIGGEGADQLNGGPGSDTCEDDGVDTLTSCG